MATSTRGLVVGLAPAALLLLFRPGNSWLLGTVLVQLSGVVAVGLLLASRLQRRLDERWYSKKSAQRDGWAAGATAVVLVTGVVALITLASSAALGYVPSLQFLQLVSAIDIAWVTAATAFGIGWWRGRRWGLTAGVLMSVVCVWSLWTYLDAVGFAPDGGWLVDAAALRRHVLPFDVAAATIALTALVIGARSRGGR